MINEEIDKIKYLFGYKPGVVISEQTTGSTPSTGVTTTPPSTGSSETTKIKQKDLDKLGIVPIIIQQVLNQIIN
jgi:hypothetical protein